MVDVPCTTFRTREDNAILLARRARQRIMKSHPWSPLSALSLSLSLSFSLLCHLELGQPLHGLHNEQ